MIELSEFGELINQITRQAILLGLLPTEFQLASGQRNRRAPHPTTLLLRIVTRPLRIGNNRCILKATFEFTY